MDKGLLPRRYAKALYKFAAEHDATTQIYSLMQRIEQAFESNHDLQNVIANPFVSLEQKTGLIMTAAGEQSSILADFIKLLSNNNRLDTFRSVALAYLTLYRQEKNIHLVNITSAAPLSEPDRRRIVDMIEKHIGNATAQYTFDVNPDLIGGFVVRVDNESLDASVRNELKQLRQKLMA